MTNNFQHKLISAAVISALLGGCAAQPVAEHAAPVTAAVPESPAAQPAAGAGTEEAAGGTAEEGANAEGKPAEQKGFPPKLIPGTGVFVKPPVAAPRPASPQDIVLNFEGADVREVIRVVLGDMLHENYTIDPKVAGTVTIHTSQPVSKEAVPQILETVLRMNGAAMLKDDAGGYRVAPLNTVLRGAATPQLGTSAPGYSVQVVQLQYISAREMAKILEPLVPEGSIVRVDELRNLLMLAGGEAEMRHALETIGIFDVDWLAGMSVGLFTLKSTEVKTLAPELDAVFGEKSKGPFAGLVRIIPIERMNAIFVVTPRPQYLATAKEWIERLDRNGAKAGTRLFVYKVQNGKADHIASLLSQVIGGQGGQGGTRQASVAPGLTGTTLQSGGSTAGGTMGGGTSTFGTTGGSTFGSGSGSTFGSGGASPQSGGTSSPNSGGAVVVSGSGEALGLGAGTTVKVIADTDNNALLVLANASEYEKIEEAVRKLDVVPRQVLVEVTIAEVNLNGDLNYGLEWYFNNANNINGYLSNATGYLPSTPTGSVPGPSSSASSFTSVWTGPTGNIKAVLTALSSKTNVRILSSPHIMVTDNQVAKINVGSSVPVQGQSTYTGSSTTPVVTSVQYVDTGVLLSVRPHINAGGLVNMEISQEVSAVEPTVTTTGLNSPTIDKRQAQTTVAVQSGDTMVLGGLITDEKDNGTSGVPILNDLPVVGALFGAKTNSDKRRELIITITPRVVNDSVQAREVTDELRRKLSSASRFAAEAGSTPDNRQGDKRAE